MIRATTIKVATPSKDEKARSRLKAALQRLEAIDGAWERMTPQRQAVKVSEVRHDLAAVVTILLGGEGTT